MTSQMNIKKLTRALAAGTIVEIRFFAVEDRPGIAVMQVKSKDGRELSADFTIPEMGRSDPDASERAFDDMLSTLQR